MAKTKIEKIAGIEEEIRQLENKRRQLVQAQKAQERKDRTKRLCKRMGLFESLLPESISLTDEQFQIFLEKTVLTEQSRRILDGLTAAAKNSSTNMTERFTTTPARAVSSTPRFYCPAMPRPPSLTAPLCGTLWRELRKQKTHSLRGRLKSPCPTN